MKIKEIREKETDAILAELRDKEKHLFDLRTQTVTEKVEDTSQFSKTRHEIAQMKTVLRERQLAQSKAQGQAQAK